MSFLIEPVYCMTRIWTLYRAHNKWKSPIEEDNVWATIGIVLCIGSNLGLKFGRERPIRVLLPHLAEPKIYK